GFSRVWVGKVLRETLGFAGAVVSDDLGMRAAAGVGDLHQRIAAALAAGCDLLLLGNEGESVASAVQQVPDIERPSLASRLAALGGIRDQRRGERPLLCRDPRWQQAVTLALQLCQDD
ncbi:MAG TPA: glycoside hydrolase family 3 N-terminal domain-containing protein, partial [Nitrococcus sp.]|nr:glycoside hydrolase family 3 N-terminal domain-containing protein [Nitrococcus sp.]